MQTIDKNVGYFSFLGDERNVDEVSWTSEAVRSLSQGVALSDEDGIILDNIIRALEVDNKLPFAWTPQERDFIMKHDQSQWLDYLIYRYKFKLYPQQHHVSEFPFYLLIEPVSSCNLRCTMCFQSDRSFTRKPFMGIMDMVLYRRIVDEAHAGGTRAVTLASRGEPTMHPQFSDMLQYATGKFLDFKVNTNATRLDEKMCHDILSSGVNELVFSIDSHVKEIYESIRLKGDFDEVQKNVERFHNIRSKYYPKSMLTTRVAGVRVREDQDPEGFVAFWSQYADHVGLKDALERWDTYQNDPIPLDHACHNLWERMYVWFDGTSNVCDADYKSKLSPGNVVDQSLASIWTGEAYTKMREAHLAGQRDNYLPCDRCGV
jgi:hypothetical protein